MQSIAMISYHTCPLSSQEGKETGGMNIYVLELSLALSNMGYIVDVYTRSQDNASQKIIQINKNFRVIHLDAGPKASLPKNKLIQFIPDFVKEIKKFIEKNEIEYDILDCHYYLSGLIGIRIKSLFKKNIPLFITFHTLALMKNLVAKTEKEKESYYRVYAEMLLVKTADIVISTGEYDAEYLKYLYSCPTEKIFIITPGVDTNHFKPMDKTRAKTYIKFSEKNKLILFVGRIEPLKGIDVLMYAMKILLEKRKGYKICLWIVGGDISEDLEKWSDELKKLEALRTLLSITAEVKFLGRKNPEELPYYYNAADIVVMPSQYESFGMSALEAMACGTPVITTDVTGVSDILDEKHQSLVTSANDPLQLSQKMENLIENCDLYKQVSEDVYKKVQGSTWEKMGNKVSNLFKKFIP